MLTDLNGSIIFAEIAEFRRSVVDAHLKSPALQGGDPEKQVGFQTA